MERLVKAKKTKNHVGLCFLEPFVGGPEVFRPMPEVYFISSDGEIPKNQVMIGVLCINESLKPPGVLETISKGVANHDDMVAGL